jgi:hypothetical protein
MFAKENYGGKRLLPVDLFFVFEIFIFKRMASVCIQRKILKGREKFLSICCFSLLKFL